MAWRVWSQRLQRNAHLGRLYCLWRILSFLIHLHSLLGFVHSLIDMHYVREGGPSHLKLVKIISILLFIKESRYGTLWPKNESGLDRSNYRSVVCDSANQNSKVRSMVPSPYPNLQPLLQLLRKRFCRVIRQRSCSTISSSNRNLQNKIADEAPEAA